MSEPNMEQVVVMLGNGDYAGEVFHMPNTNERIAWLLYYLMDDKKETLYNCIKEKTDNEKKNIFKSLVELYPLSRSIILYMFQRSAADLDDFIEIYDLDERLIEELEETISDIADSTTQISRTLKEYRQRIDKLQAEISKKEKELKEAKEAKMQLRDLESASENLDKDIKEASKTADELQEEIEEKKQILLDKNKGNKKREESLKKITDELKKIEKMTDEEAGVMPDKYQKVLSTVQKAIRDLDKAGRRA